MEIKAKEVQATWCLKSGLADCCKTGSLISHDKIEYYHLVNFKQPVQNFFLTDAYPSFVASLQTIIMHRILSIYHLLSPSN